MSLSTVKEIERAIGELTRAELDELSAWFDQYQHPFDLHLEADSAGGHLDQAMQRALNEERNGTTRLL